jgi:hypothetical protein
MQARFIWHEEAPHAVDWSYSIVTTRCPTANSTLTHFATQLAYGWLDLAVADGMSYNTTLVKCPTVAKFAASFAEANVRQCRAYAWNAGSIVIHPRPDCLRLSGLRLDSFTRWRG